MNALFSILQKLVTELRRRHVFRVAVVYAVVAFVIMQVAEIAFPALHLPDWTLTFVVVIAILGLPIAIVLAWAFELTPQGIRRAVPAAAQEPGDAAFDKRPYNAGRAIAYVAAGILISVVGYGAYAVFTPRGNDHTAAESDAKGVIRSMAVLPFTDLSPESDQGYLSDGMAVEIRDALSQIPEIVVKAQSSSFQFRESGLGARVIGDSLGVEALLEGSIRKAGDRIKVTAELIEAATGDRLWSASYQRLLSDIFAVQEEIARSVAEELRIELAAEKRLARRPTEDLGSYELYLRGRQAWRQRTADSVRRAIELFERAIARDSAFAEAYAGLADSYLLLPTYAGADFEVVLPKAQAAAVKALELDDELAEAHVSMGWLAQHERDWERAESLFRLALERDPNYATAHHWYAIVLAALGRRDEALLQAEAAYRLDPLSWAIAFLYALYLHYSGEHERALEQLRRAERLIPSQFRSQGGLKRGLEALILLELGRYEEAVAAARRHMESDSVAGLGTLGVVHARAGDTEQARRILERLRDHPGGMGAQYTLYIHAALGNADLVFALLEGRFANMNALLLADARGMPALEPIRDDPRFRELLERHGLWARE